MTIKTLGVIVIVSTALVSSAFAQQTRGFEGRNFHRAFNQAQLNETGVARTVLTWEGPRDPSVPGGWDPSFRPAGN